LISIFKELSFISARLLLNMNMIRVKMTDGHSNSNRVRSAQAVRSSA